MSDPRARFEKALDLYTGTVLNAHVNGYGTERDIEIQRRALLDLYEEMGRENDKLRRLLLPYARMDREDCDLSELACVRGVASDMTCLFSADFRRAREALGLTFHEDGSLNEPEWILRAPEEAQSDGE